LLKNLTITEDYSSLKQCSLVIECTLEDLAIKKSIYSKIEATVADQALITSKTSAIPISLLQKGTHITFPFSWITLGRTFAYDALWKSSVVI